MWDPIDSDNNRSRRPRLPLLLGGGALLGLGVAACLFWHEDLAGLAFSPSSRAEPVVETGSSADPIDVLTSTQALNVVPVISTDAPSALQTTVTTGAALLAPHDINAMIRHLEALQGSLDAISSQLEAQPLSILTPSGGSDTQALLDEMERLNQLMLPLMQQIQDAMQSGRSTSELVAMRTQMDEIHRRLTSIMDAVEASRTSGESSPTPSAPIITGDNLASAPVDPNPASYAQLQQALAQLQGLLRQMQSNPTYTAP